MVKDFNDLSDISIHAPVRGATRNAYADYEDLTIISIHAPVRGATHTHDDRYCTGSISIHAPVRGATNAIFFRKSR